MSYSPPADSASKARLKGTLVLDTMRYIVKKQGEEGLSRLIGKLDPSAQAIYRSPILPGAWFSLDLYADLLGLVVKEFEGGDETRLMRRAERVMDAQLKGVYRMFVRLGSPEWVIKRVTAVHNTYFDGVHIEVLGSSEEHRIAIRYTGFAKRHRLLEYNIQGFYRKALEISGAKEVATKFTVPMASGGTYSELVVSWT